MVEFAKMSDRRRIDNAALFLFWVCRLSDNFCKVETLDSEYLALSSFAGDSSKGK